MPSLFTQNHLVYKSLLDVWENLAHKVPQVSRELRVLQVLWGHQEGRAFKDLQALLDGWGNLVHKGLLDVWEKLAHKVPQVSRELRVLQGLWDHQEGQHLKGLQEL